MKYRLFIKNGLEESSLTKEILSVLSIDPRFEKDEVCPELVIVIGGDGTFLNAAQTIFGANKKAKFLCFNAGTIGFYNDFQEEDVKDIPSIVFANQYPCSELDCLLAKADQKTYYAFNEFNMTGLYQNIDYDVYLDHDYLEHYFGAGLIVSTPTGSMAYNRSLNGAILDPSLHLMELTEVAGIHSKAHKTIGNPLIVSSERSFHFVSEAGRGGYLIADGFKMQEEKVHDLTITYSKEKLIVYSKCRDYFVNRIHKTIDL